MANTTDSAEVASGRRTTPPVPRRSRRQPAAPAAPARRARGPGQGHHHRRASCATIEDEEIAKLVQMQRDVGLQSATDGELRRGSWHMDFIYQLGGIEKVQGDIEVHFRNADGHRRLQAGGDRRQRAGAPGPHDLRRGLPVPAGHGRRRRHAQADDPLAQHGPLPQRPRGAGPRRLPGHRAVLGGSARPPTPSRSRAHRRARAAPTSSSTTRASPTSTTPASARRSTDARRGHRRTCSRPTCATSTTRSPAGRRGSTVTTHLCRGNFRSSWAAEGGYDYVAETLFGELDVDGFFLEYDDARSGGFEPLRFVAARARWSCSGW